MEKRFILAAVGVVMILLSFGKFLKMFQKSWIKNQRLSKSSDQLTIQYISMNLLQHYFLKFLDHFDLTIDFDHTC